MTSMTEHDFHANGNERSMFVQRPSSGRCQDISHLLTKIFRDDFTRDAIDQNTVRNLTTSKSGKSGYHDQYVEKLHQIQKQWEERMEEANVIENHLQEAHDVARENEQIEERRALEDCTTYKDLGLPPVHSHLDYHLNGDLLRRFNLIVPQDFIKEDRKTGYGIDVESSPQYARPTTSSMQRYRKTPVEDNYYPENEDEDRSRKAIETNGTEILRINHSGSVDQVINSKKKTTKSVSDEKNIWRELMKPSQREIERNDLAKLQQKSDYLKNPRFVPPKSTKPPTDSIEQKENGLDQTVTKFKARDVFEPNPYPIVFTDYQAGKEYEIVLSLKNVTSSSRQLRVLPPASRHFRISLGKFPLSDGLVAPGMNCQYVVTFIPDSLADYDDVLKVETQFSQPLLIPLQARRPPPNLSLSTSFGCGHCLVGGTKTVEFPCSNNGGEGRFVIIPKHKWIAGNAKELFDSKEDVAIGPFIIQPSSFYLKPNDKLNLKISFSPEAVKKFQERVIMLCDNCQIKEFTIEGFGETANVEFVSVEGGLSSYDIGESRDETANYLVRFNEQIPGTVETRKLQIRNITSVDLEYYWLIERPTYNNASHTAIGKEDLNKEIYRHAAFAISPPSGKLLPLNTATFDLTFKPDELSIYRNVARLILSKVPISSGIDSEAGEVVTIQIELSGGTKTFQLSTHPEALIMDGDIDINLPHQLNFELFNNSSASCPVTWENIEDDDCLVRVEPATFEIGPNSRCNCHVTCVGKKPGLLRRTLLGRVAYTASPVYCHFEANFIGPVVRFTDHLLNFGLVRHMENQKRLIELKNFSSIDARWKLAGNSTEQLIVEPSSGIIDSHGTQVILVDLKAEIPCMLSNIIEIEVESGEDCYLEVRAIVERPEVVLLSSVVDIEECFANIPVSKTITLQNLTLFSVQYKWTKVLGKDSELCTLQFENEHGTLKPREKLETELILCVSEKGKIDDLVAVCEIEGMLEPLLLSLTTKVSGLKVDISTPDVSGEQTSLQVQEQLRLDFGFDVPISMNPKTVVVLKNRSAIASTFSVKIEHFSGGRIPTPPEKKRPDKHESKSRNLPLLSKTDLNADVFNRIANKTFKDHCNAVLSDGKGAAFLAAPSNGRIGPFEQIIIEVIAYMDMWGEYNDNLICSVDGLEPVKIPIHLECSGCPLNFQFSKDPNPVLRFGSHISGGDICSRTLKINNPSPCDIRLDWQCFTADDEDMQLLDLLVTIGNPFPLLDDNGLEKESDDHMTEPLIKVRLNPHQGILSTEPFKMDKKQLIVPAKGYTQATAKFIPFQNVRKKINVQGYALGFMSLANQCKFHQEEKSLRCDGLDVSPFHLNFTGSIKPARVIVEPESENGFLFEGAASSLLRSDGGSGYIVINEHITSRRFVLANNSGTPLQLSVELKDPFLLLPVDVKEAEDLNGKQLKINQGSNIELKVGLKLSPSLISSLMNGNQKHILKEEERGTDDAHQNVFGSKEVDSTMELKFPNGTKQTYDLKALIHLPVLLVSYELLDFQTCLVGQEREIHAVLKNIGKSACYWKARIDEDYPETCRSVFKVSPVSGYLEGDLEYSCRNSETIKVIFNARQNVEYECRVIFSGSLGEEPVILRLAGKGTFDQQAEQIVNILT